MGSTTETEYKKYKKECVYCENDLIDVHDDLPKKYRYLKYKHYARLLAIGNCVRGKLAKNNEHEHITFVSFAENFGCDPSIISKIANGFPNVKIQTLISILDYLKYDLYIIMESDNVKEPQNLLLTLNNLNGKLERVGSYIKRERSKQGITLSEFSKLLNMSRPTLMKLEQGSSTAYLYHYLLAFELLGLNLKLAINERQS